MQLSLVILKILDGDIIKKIFSIYYYITYSSVNENSVMNPRLRTAGDPTFGNQGLLAGSTFTQSTVYDKGLMDAREVGYIY
jgi:hypothetical protein